jgi:hypothetical protein
MSGTNGSRREAVDVVACPDMKYHSLNSDTACPACGHPCLAYKRSSRYADVYECAECRCSVMHWRRRGESGCGFSTRGTLSYGTWRPCPLRDAGVTEG